MYLDMARAPELTVVGLDAATFDVIDPMIAAGELPNLAGLFAQGARGILRSTTHPLTTQAWTTMLTGVNAGRHGMWDFAERAGYRLRLVNGSYRRAPALWEHLTARKRRVGIVNVPFTWPAQEVSGFQIAGIDAAAREKGMTYPDDLLAELRRRYGKLELDHALPLNRDGYIDLDRVRAAVEQKVDAALWLSERFEPELLLVVFMAADHMQHYGWLEWERQGLESRVAEVYRMLDDAVGTLTDAFGHEKNFLVVSDHGAGRMKGVVNINSWLAEHGWLTYADSKGMLRGELPRLVLYKLLEQRRRLPKGLRNFVKQRAPTVRDRMHELKEFTAIDFAKTSAFAYGNMGNVVINVRGREEHGIVEPGADYDKLCREIRAKALDLRHPETGELLIAEVHRRDDLFDGPELEKIPDLIFEFDHYAWAGKGNLMSRTPTMWDVIKMAESGKETYVGTHRHEGIIALRGPSVAEGRVLSANIQDVAPTIMYLLGEPIPAEFEGRLLEEAIVPALLAERPPDFVSGELVEVGAVTSYGAEAAEEVGARLRDLGYLE
jgi:predicted AlkP superfamily phosphohydrolase/phosphomutase